MTDLEIYRARIGRYILRNCGGNKSFKSTKCSRILGYLMWRILLALALSSICFYLILVLIMLTGACRESLEYSNLNLGLHRGTNEVRNLWPSSMMVRNYQPRARDWNSYMKALNGNKTCLDVAHWNGGSSHLGKSSKGKEKLLHTKFLLSKYNLDVLGLSEANLHNSVNELEYKIDNYKIFHQDSKDCNIC